MADAPNFQPLNGCSYCSDCSISLKLLYTELDYYVTRYTSTIHVKDQVSKVKLQRENVQIIALLRKLGVVESNGNVSILIGSCEIAVCATFSSFFFKLCIEQSLIVVHCISCFPCFYRPVEKLEPIDSLKEKYQCGYC